MPVVLHVICTTSSTPCYNLIQVSLEFCHFTATDFCPQAPSIIEYKEYHTDVSVRFQIEVAPERMAEWQAAGLESKLKLTSKFATSECPFCFALGCAFGVFFCILMVHKECIGAELWGKN